jgi:hypothetical protein
MYSGAEEHVIYQVANAPIREYPFPHIYVESVFPQDFYAELRRNWPTGEHLVSLSSTGRVDPDYSPERFVMPLCESEVNKLPCPARQFWSGFAEWLVVKQRFMQVLIEKFGSHVERRFGPRLSSVGFYAESLVVRDHTNFALGPHTDAPHRLMSLLFYCPDDDATKHLGTSLYTPIDPEFSCSGGRRYPQHLFRKVTTMEYRPNTLFAFLKTDTSFHGVEPIGDSKVLRDVLLYDIRVEETPAAADAAPPPGGRPQIGLRMLQRIFSGKK